MSKNVTLDLSVAAFDAKFSYYSEIEQDYAGLCLLVFVRWS